MTAIHDYGASGFRSRWTSASNAEQDTVGADSATEQDVTAGNTQSSVSRNDGAPALSSAVQATLIANQTRPSVTYVPSAALIAAADLLAQDIVRALDTNHNGTLSKAEIAAVSPLAAWASDALDTNRDGQVSATELASAMLAGNGPLPI